MPTKDEVRQAIEDLEASGDHVSPTAIRDQLGGHGSFRDIVRHQKEIFSEGPRPQPRPPAPAPPLPRNGNGLHGAHRHSQEPGPYVSPPPAREPAPLDQRARLEHCLALARERKGDLEEEMEHLRARAMRAMAMPDVREFNRKIVGTERALEAISRDIAQYLSELSRLG